MRNTLPSDEGRACPELVEGSPDQARFPSKAGERRLRETLRRISSTRTKPRRADPQPYEPDWGWWVERRLVKIESTQKWLIGLAAGALIAQLIRLVLS